MNIGQFQIGGTPWNKGKKGVQVWTKKSKKKLSKSLKGMEHPWVTKRLTGKGNPNWKETGVSYRGLHYWVSRILGKPSQCQHCKKTGNGHTIHWANISGKYLRDKNDWIRLCPKCHKKYDKR